MAPAPARFSELLDAQRDAFLFLIHIEDDGFDLVALLVVLDGFFARTLPVEIGKMRHAVDIAVEADEQAEFGDVLDFTFNDRALRILGGKGHPRILLHLLEAQRNAALGRVDFQDLNLNRFRRGKDLARMHVLLRPAHFRNMDEAFNAIFQFHEGAVVGDIGDLALDLRADNEFLGHNFPRIAGPAASCQAICAACRG